jgi:hypothetical protein
MTDSGAISNRQNHRFLGDQKLTVRTSAPTGIVADIEKDWGPQSAVFIPTKRARGKILSYY